jgi:undecaprenyl pyrophosphate phosphatase UppP
MRPMPFGPCGDEEQPLWRCNLSEKIEALTVATLGALQGLTEFLPVSSSGHVAIGAHFFDIRENSLPLVILLHLGTLMATIVFFREDIGNLAVEGLTAVRQPSRLRATPEGRTLVCSLRRKTS